MISGGLGAGTNILWSAEIYNPETRGGCKIPNMPTIRSSPVTKEFLVCGGFGGRGWTAGAGDCVNFNPKSGTWENAHKLNQGRFR